VLHDALGGQAEAATLLDGDGIALDLGRPVHVVESFVPEVETLGELSEVSQLVEQVEVEVEVLTGPVVALGDDDTRGLDVDEGVPAAPPDLHDSTIEEGAEGVRIGRDAGERRAPHDTRQHLEKWVIAGRE